MLKAAQPLPEELVEAHRLIGQLRDQLTHKEALIGQLLHQLQGLRRHRFGQRSEQLPADLQGELFAALEALGIDPPPPPPESKPDTASRQKPKRQPPPAHLPRERIEYRLEEAACTCAACGERLERIGEERSEQLEYIPASFFVYEHVRFKYACSQCEAGGVVTAPKPPQALDKGLPGPGLLSHVLTSKFCDHLPLTRQQGIFKRERIHLPVSTLVGWVKSGAETLEPLVERMRVELLRAPKIHTDDTPVPVQDKDRTQTKKGRLWVYLREGAHACTVFDYTPTRARDGPERFLKDYRGYLQADAYAGYEALYARGQLTEVGCWAHARRRYVEATPSDRNHAEAALAYIGALYGIERELKESSAEDRARERQVRAVPILNALKLWLDETLRVVLPKSPLGQAIQYTLNQWAALNRYTENGELAIDNNVAERAIRPLVLGRLNWKFAGSDAGAKRAAILYSLIATCKQHGIDPYAYLRDTLARLPTTLNKDIDTLLPWNWSPPES